MKDLKDYRSKELLAYMFANTLLFLLSIGLLDGIEDVYAESFINLISMVLESAIYGSIFSIYVFLMDSLVPGDCKDRIAWFGKYNLPGCKIFTDIKNKDGDIRFEKEEALHKYETIYNNMPTDKTEKSKYQNAAWYKMYRKYRDNGSVYAANRDYLLCRDLYISTLSIAVLYVIAVLCLDIWENICILSYAFCWILIAEGVVTNVAMRSKGWRFSYNVIVEDIASKEETIS